jgi:hypothetical protein
MPGMFTPCLPGCLPQNLPAETTDAAPGDDPLGVGAELALGALRAEHHHTGRLIIRPQSSPAVRSELARLAALGALEHPLDLDRIPHGQDATRRPRRCLVPLFGHGVYGVGWKPDHSAAL